MSINGCLHTVGGPIFAHADRLAKLLIDFPRVDIVLSTSWREIYPFDDLRNVFGEELSHRVIGATPVITQKEPPYLPHVRHREIQLWFRHHSRETKRGYTILDDEQVLFPTDCPELILCDPRTGIDDRIEGLLRGRFSIEAKDVRAAGQLNAVLSHRLTHPCNNRI